MVPGDLVRFNPVYMFYDYTTEELARFYQTNLASLRG